MISPTYQGQLYDASTAATVESTGTESAMGRDAFLKMFMAQVTNQNPLDPMDNTEFTAQLATFSQLEQLQSIASGIEKLTDLDRAMKQTNALAYLGKEVVMEGDVLPVAEGHVGSVGYTLASDADEVQATITDASGEVVAQLDLGQLDAGVHEFTWDGQDSYGNQVPDGTYQVTLSAHDSMGGAVAISDMTTTGLVTGYQLDSEGNPYLLIGKSALSISDVISVRHVAQGNTASETLAEWASQQTTGTDSDEELNTQEVGDITELLNALASVGSLAAALL